MIQAHAVALVIVDSIVFLFWSPTMFRRFLMLSLLLVAVGCGKEDKGVVEPESIPPPPNRNPGSTTVPSGTQRGNPTGNPAGNGAVANPAAKSNAEPLTP